MLELRAKTVLPRAVVDQFQLAAAIPILQKTFPQLGFAVEDRGELTPHHYNDLTNVVAAMKSCPEVDAKNHAKLIARFEKILEQFKKIAISQAQPKKSVPVGKKKQAESPSLDRQTAQQLQELREICRRLSDPCARSLQQLLELSWGIGSLPRERKYSDAWCSFISKKHWMLLEDAARQICLEFPDYPQLSAKQAEEIERRLGQFSNCAESLGEVFGKFLASPVPKSEKPVLLPDVEMLFYPGFDAFVQGHLQSRLRELVSSVGAQMPADWLRSPEHVKAFFRLIEMAGEASKILSSSAKQRFPTLRFGCDDSGEKSLWGKLRNLIYHNKSRCWDIALYAPELWGKVLTGLFPQLLRELSGDPAEKLQGEENLKELQALCEQDHFHEIRWRWNAIKEGFALATDLEQIIFGITSVKMPLQQIWENYARPSLKDGRDAERMRLKVFEILRLLHGNFALESDIEALSGKVSRQEAVAKLKQLLSQVSRQNDKKQNVDLSHEFNQIADGFVFLAEPKELLKRDTKKNEALKRLMSERINQVSPCHVSAEALKNGDGSWNNYGKLLVFYTKLKQRQLSELLNKMKDSLGRITQEWSQFEVTPEALKTLETKPKPKKDNPKGIFTNNLNALRNEKHLIDPVWVKELALWNEDVKYLSADIIPKKDVVNAVQEVKNKCLAACSAIHEKLNMLSLHEEEIAAKVNSALKEHLYLAIESFQGARKKGSDGQLIHDCQFADIDQFEAQLEKPQFAHPEQNSLDDQLTKLDELQKKVEELANASENELCFSFVQNYLQTLSSLPAGITRQQIAANLEEIYCSGLKSSSSRSLAAWNNVRRKIESKRLPYEDYQKVMSWIDATQDKAKERIKKQLVAFLDGHQNFDSSPLFHLEQIPRFEHALKKLETFEKFLKEDCFPAFPQLVAHEDELLAAFRIAYGLKETQHKAHHFIDNLHKQLTSLEGNFATILRLENQQADLNVALLAAEYDMQNIGETAQLITERPPLWDNCRHILSPHHLAWMSLSRKMLAHYPLRLSPEIIRWNLEFLAFDTQNLLLQQGAASTPASNRGASVRQAMTGNILRQHLTLIEDHLDRLHLSLNAEIIHPLLNMSHFPSLHPLGDLALLVHPKEEGQTKVLFQHALMELELILSYELSAKVTVMGMWHNQLVRSSAAYHIPQGCMHQALLEKQTFNQWILSHHAYELFETKPWSLVTFQSGEEVTRTDWEHHRVLKFFFNLLDIPTPWETLPQDIEARILDRLNREFETNKIHPDYSTSPLFKWICCLFECFSPPKAIPKAPIRFPKACGAQRPLATMLDTAENGLLLLPEQASQCPDSAVRSVYYNGDRRWDFSRGRSLLSPHQPVDQTELPFLAQYAAAVLTAPQTRDHIKKYLHPYCGLEKAQFRFVKSVQIADPMLVEQQEEDGISPDDLKPLICQEAKELAKEMVDLLKYYGNAKNWLGLMLDWMSIDKSIEQLARSYYGQHRSRLRLPYLQLDPLSKSKFDAAYILTGTRLKDFPFVNSFRVFIERIYLECDRLSLGKDLQAAGQFSAGFKELISENNFLDPLMELLKKRKRIVALISAEKIPNVAGNKALSAIFKDWNALFRMIVRPDFFENLKSCVVEKYSSSSQRKLISGLAAEFEYQYRHPLPEREYSSAKKDEVEEVQLLEAKAYFDMLHYYDRAKRQHEKFIKLLGDLNLSEDFSRQWRSLFHQDLQPVVYDNPLLAAQEAINILLTSKTRVPQFKIVSLPSYSDYWRFICGNLVTMTSTYMTSGLNQTFKSFVKEGGELEDLLKDGRAAELQSNRAIFKLIKDYLPFCRLQIAYSDWRSYQDQQADKLRSLHRQMELKQAARANKQPGEEEKMALFAKRIDRVQKSLQKADAKLRELRAQIAQTEFYLMLRLWMRRDYLLAHGQEPNASELDQDTISLLK